MESTSDLPAWFVPVLVLGFPIVFIGMWSSICALIAFVSGYRFLAPLRVSAAEAADGEQLPTPRFAMIGGSLYRGGILSLRSSSKGLTLRISRLFPFHKPVRVPWDRIQEVENGGLLRGRRAGTILLDGRVRLRVPEATLAAIREAKTRHAGKSASDPERRQWQNLAPANISLHFRDSAAWRLCSTTIAGKPTRSSAREGSRYCWKKP